MMQEQHTLRWNRRRTDRIDRGLAGPGLHVLVAKYTDHLPLYPPRSRAESRLLHSNATRCGRLTSVASLAPRQHTFGWRSTGRVKVFQFFI
jgi:hypothetical protein